MMQSQEIKALAGQVMMNTYGRYDLALVRGEGMTVYDPEGNAYLDFVGGIAVTSLGHCHPAVTRALTEQAATLIHVSNLYYTLPQVELARILTENCFADRVFLCNSGAEANEAGIKLARKYSYDHYGPDRYTVVTMDQSFHGRTMATLSATGQPKIHKGFTPLVAGFRTVPWGDLDALARSLDGTVCGVLVEPIQGEGGVNEPPAGYLQKLCDLCRERDVLVIFDEVQVGMGRTGKLFAHEHYGVTPDIMTLAKAIANGLPMGACLATEKVAASFGPGTHATTFGGTPLVTAAAVAVLQTMLAPGFLEHVTEVGAYFKKRLQELAGQVPGIRQVRGRGLILGLELDFSGGGVITDLMKKGFLLNCTNDRVLRFIPPLIVTEQDIDRLIPVLAEVVTEHAAKAGGPA